MRKTGSPWYRKGKDAWYVWYDGRQVQLAKGKANKGDAFARFAELLAGAGDGAAASQVSVGQLVTRFLLAARDRVKPGTLTAYTSVLKALVAKFGGQPALSLTAPAVESWAERPGWSTATRRYALTVVTTLYRWAEAEKVIPANPLPKLRKPPARSRGAEVLIGDELHQRIAAVASQEFVDFLTAVRGTGARPGEVARVTAADVVWDAACWVLTDHKTARTGRVRTIYLPADVLSLCRHLAEQHPTGPLFRTTRGEPWRKTSWKQAMARAQRKLGLTRRPLTSGYRHTFATDALEAGVPDAHVAELLGHAGTTMIHRHYGHLTAKGRALRAALDRVRG